MMLQDPIVTEIRAIREKIAADCEHDLHKIYLRGMDAMRRWQGRVVTEEELSRDPARLGRKPSTH